MIAGEYECNFHIYTFDKLRIDNVGARKTAVGLTIVFQLRTFDMSKTKNLIGPKSKKEITSLEYGKAKRNMLRYPCNLC